MKFRTSRNLSALLYFLVFMAIVLMPAFGSVWAGTQGGKLVFILDGSGSMWGEVEGKAKIDVAREVLTGLIRDLSPGVEVGLIAYGHRSKGDCNDVEELVPLGPVNKGDLINKIKSISPKGKTPISYSVRMTAEKLRSVEEEATILLVSDGEETCGGDPCAVVRELKESGIKFVMHVIGFDVAEKEKAQLECIAKAGQGRYFAAANAKEFSIASKKVTESVTIGEKPGKLTLAKTTFVPLEMITVAFSAQPDYAESAWIGLIPSTVPHTEHDSDANDLAYQYIKKKTAGEMIFKAPREEGSYDFRMYNTDTGGKEMASVTFQVKGKLETGLLKMEKEAFAPGESIVVHFIAKKHFDKSAWVGLFPSNAPHGKDDEADRYDLTYEYIKGRSEGTVTFRAPYENGTYDVRMFDSNENGDESASLPFVVKGELAKGALKLTKDTFGPGEVMQVQFTASPNYLNNAWIGLIPSNIPHGKSAEADNYDLAYEYVKGRLDGSVTFRAPYDNGSYDIRMFDAVGGLETASVRFTVKGELEKGTLKLEKDIFKPEEIILVQFTASSNYQENAWIGTIPSKVPHGKDSENDNNDLNYQYLNGRTSGTMEFKAPTEPGSYDLRMNDPGSGRETASVTFTVK